MSPRTKILIVGLSFLATLVWALVPPQTTAFPRYQDGCNTTGCHGDFTGPETTKGSTFPGDDKHQMHRDGASMNTDCDLCHTQGDNRNPFLGSSNGTNDTPGLGCTGCHAEIGLRQHHFNNGQTWCYQSGCHSTDPPSSPESTDPPYYVSPDTDATDACNTSGIANTGENWTVTDTIGIDNDGDDLYDTADPDCAATGNTPGEVQSLLVTAKAGGAVDLGYGSGCSTADNILVWGDLAQVSTYTYSGQMCAVGNTGALNWTLPAGDVFFLIVGNDGTNEGSYGSSSAGTERPEETACTFTQDLTNTCVN